jgi:FixJ family two-component response regulator
MKEVEMGSTLTESLLERKVNSTFRVRESTALLEAKRIAPVVFLLTANGPAGESLDPMISSAGWHLRVFTSFEECLVYSRELIPSCLILDVSDLACGLDLQKRFAVERPHIPIIFLSDNANVTTTVRAIKAGAIEYLIKPLRPEQLLGAIREALEQSRFALEYETEQHLLCEAFGTLSNRERQVMALLALGLLNKQVAGELGITEATVKAHRGQVMQKMKAISYPDLVRMAARLGVARDLQLSWLRPAAGHAPYLLPQPLASNASAPLEACKPS